ncbi:ribosome assembly factor SBDS [Thermoplasmatota archaeon]
MVSLDDAVIARLKKGEEHFEILVDPYSAAELIDGNEIDIMKCLAIDSVFKDSKKGTHASEESLKKNFNTENIEEIAKLIILKGEIQLTTEQRHKMKESKKNRIIEKIVKNAMDPKTKAPHPRQRIELAMDEAKVNIDPFKPVRDQVKTIIDLLKPLIPLSFDKIRISVKIPPEYVGKAYGIARNYGVLEREDWQSDGSWIGIVKIPAGMQNDFYDRLNDMTKGNVLTKILK